MRRHFQTPAHSQDRIVDDHFSLWEDAWFERMAEERQLDDLLDRLFPT